MRLPTFSRQSDPTTETADRAPVAPRTSTAAHSAPGASDRPASDRAASVAAQNRANFAPDDEPTTVSMDPVRSTPPAARRAPAPPSRPSQAPLAPGSGTPGSDAPASVAPAPVAAGPKPRASLLATLGLITGVAAALLVLSGPLLGYGIGVAGLALVLSLAGLRATRKRHVAGKSDALIGVVLALAAIVVGIFALTGSLSWLGTDMQPVSSLREWLDAQFIDRF